MALTPEEQAELEQLNALAGQTQPAGLTPQEEEELAMLNSLAGEVEPRGFPSGLQPREAAAQKPVEEQVAGLRAFGSGATFGISERALGALPEGISPDMTLDQLREKFPGEVTANEIIGMLSTAALPFAGAAKVGQAVAKSPRAAQLAQGVQAATIQTGRVGQAARGVEAVAPVARRVGEAVGGAAITAGLSKLGGEEVDFSSDASLAAAIEVAPPAIKAGLKGAKRALKSAGKKTLTALSGVPRKAIDDYLEAGSRLKNLEKVESIDDEFLALADDLGASIDDLQQRVIAGSRGATEALSGSKVVFKRDELVSALDGEVGKLLVNGVEPTTTGARSAIKEIKEYRDFVLKQPGEITESTAKLLIKGLKDEVNFIAQNGSFDDPSSRAFKSVRRFMDQILKSKNPEYKERMVQVANETGLLSDISKNFGKPKARVSQLQRIDSRSSLENRRLLERFTEFSDRDFVQAAKDLKLLRVFDADATRGSKGVNLFALMGIGTAAGIGIEGSNGALVGAFTGALVDRFGPKTAKKIIEVASKFKKAPTINEIRGATNDPAIRRFLGNQLKGSVIRLNNEKRQGGR